MKGFALDHTAGEGWSQDVHLAGSKSSIWPFCPSGTWQRCSHMAFRSPYLLEAGEAAEPTVVTVSQAANSYSPASPGWGRWSPDLLWNACWGSLCLLRPAWRRACSRCFQPGLRAGPGQAHATEALQEDMRHTSG